MMSMKDATCKNFKFYGKNVLGRKNSAEHTFSVAGCRKASRFRQNQTFL